MDAYLSTAFTPARQLAEIEDTQSVTLLAERQDALIGYAQLRAGEPPACVADRSAIELARYGITVNAYAPAGATRMTLALYERTGGQPPADADPELNAPLCLPRFG